VTTRRRLLDVAVAVGAVLIVLAVVVDVVTISTGHVSADVIIDLVVAPAMILLALIAPAIVRRRPGNPIGTIFVALLLVTGPALLADPYAVLVADPGSGSRPLDHLAAWVSSWAWVLPVSLLLCELPLRFPDGTLLSRRWRWSERVVLFDIVAFSLALAFVPGRLDNYPIDNPLGIEAGRVPFGVLELIGAVLLLACVAQGAVAIAVRFRRARGLERQQLKMLLAAVLGVTLAIVVAIVVSAVLEVDVVGIALAVGVSCIVLSAGLAVLRYRLYDIDHLISRTLSWVVITALLGVTYAALVLAGQAVFSSLAGGSNLAIAVSTLVVAALFLPLRARVQRVVDRRFYRRRYDAQRTLEAFGARLREEVDLGSLAAELRGVVQETIQPAHVSLWLREARP
jgi:hypothetical protein